MSLRETLAVPASAFSSPSTDRRRRPEHVGCHRRQGVNAASWHHGVMASRRHGITASWRHSVNLFSWQRGVMAPRRHGVTGSWRHDVIASRRRGVVTLLAAKSCRKHTIKQLYEQIVRFNISQLDRRPHFLNRVKGGGGGGLRSSIWPLSTFCPKPGLGLGSRSSALPAICFVYQ